ncbi:MAG: hypothetical protein OXE77_00125 [Flavobacteriaceae bacterium]|nr:hypothetical protein [Flavobacteriaceae bacterium]MCY4267000.1 hypothetical protein [Flavobacteriaceae bacterium]
MHRGDFPSKNAFFENRRSGRDFHQHPWRYIPIPSFCHKNGVHKKLASMTKLAGQSIAEMKNIPHGQVAASKRIRERLTENGIFDKIDSLVKRILPDHVSNL